MSRRLTRAEIEELLLEIGDPTTQEEVAQRSKLTKLGKSITNMGDKLRVGVINTLDAIQTNHKKRKFEKFCKKEHIFGVHVDGSLDYDEVQSVIQDILEPADKMKQYAAMSNKITPHPAAAKADDSSSQPVSNDKIEQLMQAINVRSDAILENHKKRKFDKWCEEQGILGVDVVGGSEQIDYDEMQRLIQESTDKIYQAMDLDAQQKDNPPEREM